MAVPEAGLTLTGAMVDAKVRHLFPAAQQAAAVALLGAPPELTLRVQLAALKLAGADLARLAYFCDEARKDHRDVLAPAEYPRESAWPPPATPAELDEAQQADLAEYLAWLGPLDDREPAA